MDAFTKANGSSPGLVAADGCGDWTRAWGVVGAGPMDVRDGLEATELSYSAIRSLLEAVVLLLNMWLGAVCGREFGGFTPALGIEVVAGLSERSLLASCEKLKYIDEGGEECGGAGATEVDTPNCGGAGS